MDQASFDRLARLLGGTVSRRAGLGAVLAGILGSSAPEQTDARRDGRRADRGSGKGLGGGRAKPEGPCGSGSRKDNICTRDKDCCTGLCNTKTGKKNHDGKGRCRCVKKNGACKEDRNCCSRKGQTLSCMDGICTSGGGLIPTGDPCTPTDACADNRAACTTYESGTPTGTYCLLPRGDSCTADKECEPGACFQGVCASCNCGACSMSCDSPTVCSTCTHTTIQAAINAATAGDTILIGAGTYNEDVAIDKNLNLKACGAVTVKNATYGNRTIAITNQSRVEIIDLVIDGYNDSGPANSGGGINSDGKLYLCRNTIVQNAWFNGTTQGGGVLLLQNNAGDSALYVWDQTIIQDNEADSYGGGVFVDSYGTADIAHGAKIINNKSGKGAGISYYFTDKVCTIRHSALIDGNAAGSRGGGIDIYSQSTTGTFDLQISGKAKISNNTAVLNGGGISSYYAKADQPEYISLSGNAEISNNTADSYGGGIYTEDMCVRISGNAKIANNHAKMRGGGIATSWFTNGFGTGVYAIDLSGDAILESNIADSYGGGFWASLSPVRIAGNAGIKTNSAPQGGGGYVYGTPILVDENATITGNTSNAGNSNLPGDGAGLNLVETTDANHISGSVVISGNIAANQGGGILLYDTAGAATPIVFAAGTSVTGNTANGGAGSGGGLYSTNSDAGTTVTGGSVITGNTPDNCAGTSC